MARKPKTGAPAAVATPAPMAVTPPTVTVTARRDRRRAGRFFPRGQPVALAGVTADELAALKADPVLEVVEN